MALQVGASQGWGHCGHPRRHFFRGGRAVCNRFFISGAALEVSDVPTSRDCGRCRHTRDKETAASQVVGTVGSGDLTIPGVVAWLRLRGERRWEEARKGGAFQQENYGRGAELWNAASDLEHRRLTPDHIMPREHASSTGKGEP